MIRLAQAGECGLCVLEPGNLRRLREGDPIALDLSQFGLQGTLTIAYCPDIEWLEVQIKKNMPLETDKLSDLLRQGLTMKPIDRGTKPS